MTPLVVTALMLAALPALLFTVNLLGYRRAPRATPKSSPPRLSILIPARNEEAAIVPALESVLANRGVELEAVVLDDHSTDGTAQAVASLAARDPRVRLVEGASLPAGWCGKQHACWQLARAARHGLLVFMDADVRLAPDALARLAGFLEARPQARLVSGVPRQFTGTFLERLLIPLIHFVLLGYLPLFRMRRSRATGYAAGCGQLFIARRDAYFAADGHRAIRDSLHDGIKLPRAFRRAGFLTDLVDITDLATCRMYRSGGEVWRGLGKNATEGLAHPAAIVPWTLLLLGGQVLPWAALGLAWGTGLAPLAALACGLSLWPRLVAAARFRQSWLGAALHPLGVLALVLIQWEALAARWRGRPQQWRGRSYAPHAPAGVEG
ncbi:MAG TPA: glycosyltransferase family 2 protein [Verrucomicrobiota bacterium]|nr:glycosyltransferase family 2 protein [Verrucomicrobiota bacterium]